MSRYFCFGECGCKYETMTKEQILAAVEEQKCIVYKESATVISAAGEKVIQLSNDLFKTFCLVEIFASNGNSRSYLNSHIKINSTYVTQNFVVIPLENSANQGDLVDLMIKITPLNTNYDGEPQVYVHL